MARTWKYLPEMARKAGDKAYGIRREKGGERIGTIHAPNLAAAKAKFERANAFQKASDYHFKVEKDPVPVMGEGSPAAS